MQYLQKQKAIIVIFLFALFQLPLLAQLSELKYQKEIFWQVNGNAILWDLSSEKRLPHSDHIEMDGQRVGAIIHYTIDENKKLTINRDVLFPQLRRLLQTNDPAFKSFRAYLRETYKDDLLPVITIDGRRFAPGAIDSIVINGKISFYHEADNGIKLIRTFFPAATDRMLVEKWTLINSSGSAKKMSVGNTSFEQNEAGLTGMYQRKVFSDAPKEISIPPYGQHSFAIYFTASLNDEPPASANFAVQEKLRDNFLDSIKNSFVVNTPDKLLNTLFYFSKVRAAESIYQTSMGLVHSPGGGSYYTGVWANDQAEYSGPFFPYLGYSTGVTAAMNAYKMFLKNIPGGDGKMWSSFEMNGELPCCSQDRGDAAMIAFGCTHFCLVSGNKSYSDTLWPLIDWVLKYCEKKKTADGVIASVSDELEGRFGTGTANLSTSSLYYGALLLAADLARATGKPSALSKEYLSKAKQLAAAIENYFGAEIEGLNTYKYYKENTTLRSWICLPLVMGITQRRDATLDALFNKLWTENGVRTELTADTSKAEVFWDRGTLYSFRGAFKAGAADRALQKLTSFSATRLTGFHVPYVVEAWPEGDMAHLSAESALYCRIFTEGILGLQPTGFHSFNIQPNLPATWDHFYINNIAAFNSSFDILIDKAGNDLVIKVANKGNTILSKKIKNGTLVKIDLGK